MRKRPAWRPAAPAVDAPGAAGGFAQLCLLILEPVSLFSVKLFFFFTVSHLSLMEACPITNPAMALSWKKFSWDIVPLWKWFVTCLLLSYAAAT